MTSLSQFKDTGIRPEYVREHYIAPREQSQRMKDAKWESENTWPKQIAAGAWIVVFFVSASFLAWVL